MSDSQDKPEIIVDEDWKSQVQAEKEALKQGAESEEDAEKAPGGASSAKAADAEQPPPLPPASFPELATMLATQASMLLQEAADPSAPQKAATLDHAKHFIDLLGVLQEKTSGNLTPDEATMLEDILHQLRMAFLGLSGRLPA